MVAVENLIIVFIAGLITAIATGLGALPFFFVDDLGEKWLVGLWGLAGGIMVSASVFGLINEAMIYGSMFEIGIGLLIGVLLVEFAGRFIHQYEFEPREIAEADFKKMVLILGILTVHSFPEGVAIGVSFAEISLGVGMNVFGFVIPILAVFMTVAIAIQNIPEGLAVSIPLHSFGYSKKRMIGAAVFSSLPQPIGAVLAYYFVVLAKQFLPIGFGFAAGAMIYLVASDIIPEALEQGENLPGNGRKYLFLGLLAGFLSMAPLTML